MLLTRVTIVDKMLPVVIHWERQLMPIYEMKNFLNPTSKMLDNDEQHLIRFNSCRFPVVSKRN